MSRLYANVFVPTCMSRHGRSAQDLIRDRIFVAEDACGMKSVNKEGSPAFSIGMGKEVEKLKTAGIGEVCSVRVGRQCK